MQRILITIYFLVVFALSVDCQLAVIEAYSESWSIQDGLKSSNVVQLFTDSIGKIYLSFENGTQKFDGANFINFKHQSNIHYRPVSIVGKDNCIYHFIGNKITKTSNDLYEVKILENSIELTQEDLNSGLFKIIHESNDHFWLSYGNNSIVLIDKKELKIKSRKQLDKKVSFYFGQNLFFNDSILCIENYDFKWLSYNENGLSVSQPKFTLDAVNSILPISQDLVLCLKNNLIYLVSLSKKKQELIQQLPFSKNPFRSFLKNLSSDNYLISFDNHLFKLNIKTKRLQKIIDKKTKSNFFKNSPIISITLDKYNNIWLSSLAEGIVKITLPTEDIISFGKKEGNFITSFYWDETNRFLTAGTLNGGITIYDSLSKVVFKQHLNKLGTPIMIWKNRTNEYCYSTLLSKNINRIIYKNGTFKESLFGESPVESNYYAFQLKNVNSDRISIVANNQHLEIQRNTDRLTIINSNKIDANGILIYCGLVYDKEFYIGSNGCILVFDEKFTLTKKISLMELGSIRTLSHGKEHNIILGSKNGLYEFNTRTQANKKIASSSIYSSAGSFENGLWFGTDQGLIYLHKGKSRQFTTNDGLSCQEYNGNCSYTFGANKFIFGGIGGIDLFEQDKFLEKVNEQKCILSQIKINGQSEFEKYSLDKILVLPHDLANISFSLSILGKGLMKNNATMYFLEGMDKHWNHGEWNSTINYHLAPGNYTFHYTTYENYLKNKFETISIKIKEPYFKRWWFLLLSFISILALASYIINLINKINYEKHKAAVDLKEKLNAQRSEFSKELHDVIGSQLGVVSRNIDHVKEELQSLSIEKSKMILSNTYDIALQMSKDLRDTLWVANTKEITMDVFVSRLKDHIFLYQDAKITIKVIENYTNKNLEPLEAFNLFRIIMEAVDNAVKHSNGNKINIEISKDEITIIDNGNGALPKENIGFGLSNMKLRAGRIGYTFEINFSPHGTKVIVKKN